MLGKHDPDKPGKPALTVEQLRTADPRDIERMAAMGDQQMQQAFAAVIDHEHKLSAIEAIAMADVFINTLEMDLALASIPYLGSEEA